MQTAHESVDYERVHNYAVSLATGASTRMYVNITEDTEPEADETFVVVMSGLNAGWGFTNLTVTIVANDREYPASSNNTLMLTSPALHFHTTH